MREVAGVERESAETARAGRAMPMDGSRNRDEGDRSCNRRAGPDDGFRMIEGRLRPGREKKPIQRDPGVPVAVIDPEAITECSRQAPGDSAEEEMAIRNLDRDSNALRQIHRALLRIAHRRNGVCQHCEEDILPKRMAVVLWALFVRQVSGKAGSAWD